ncbi:MAG: Permease of the drug/metabolite transporter (DMT) superfamily, partial [uncultured Thermomicrobiales bacterium]
GRGRGARGGRAGRRRDRGPGRAMGGGPRGRTWAGHVGGRRLRGSERPRQARLRRRGGRADRARGPLRDRRGRNLGDPPPAAGDADRADGAAGGSGAAWLRDPGDPLRDERPLRLPGARDPGGGDDDADRLRLPGAGGPLVPPPFSRAVDHPPRCGAGAGPRRVRLDGRAVGWSRRRHRREQCRHPLRARLRPQQLVVRDPRGADRAGGDRDGSSGVQRAGDGGLFPRGPGGPGRSPGRHHGRRLVGDGWDRRPGDALNDRVPGGGGAHRLQPGGDRLNQRARDGDPPRRPPARGAGDRARCGRRRLHRGRDRGPGARPFALRRRCPPALRATRQDTFGERL